jgi:alcohol dehydrogenase (cytochrome c)
MNPATGEIKWEYKLFTPPWAGLLSTAGNLVFGGTNEGQVFALHAVTGKPLWRYQAGGAARSNPISYSVDGKQYVATTMGNTLFVFGLE